MAFVWLCATPCGATGPTAGGGTGGVALPAVSRPAAAVELPLHALPALVALPALHRGAVSLVLAVAVVAGLSAGDAPAIAAARDVRVVASTPAPAAPGVEQRFPDSRNRV